MLIPVVADKVVSRSHDAARMVEFVGGVYASEALLTEQLAMLPRLLVRVVAIAFISTRRRVGWSKLGL